MKNIKNFITIFFLIVYPHNLLSADIKTAFINIEYIVQNSNAGKKTLKKIDELNKKNISLLEKNNKILRDLEATIKNKKNIISEDDYNNEVVSFKKKVQDFTIEKDKIVKDFNIFRKEELEKLFNSFRSIIDNYMNKNSINIIIDSKYVFMGIENVNLTEDILKIINNELK